MPAPIDQPQMGLYLDGYGLSNVYTLVSGVAVMPLAKAQPTDPGEMANFSPVVILQLHAPYRVRKVSRNSGKQNEPPILPTPQSVGKFEFIGGMIGIVNAINSTNYNSDWTVESEYIYVENCISRPEDGFVLGSPPFKYLPTADSIAAGGGPTPSIGAVASAGAAAQAGYKNATGIVPDGTTGYVSINYFNPTFYPYQVMNDTIDNGSI